jgi:hypothetical protein
MAKDFFEISINRLPVIPNLENQKYTSEEYQKMATSLNDIQNYMDKGFKGKEILAMSDPNDPYSIGETYKQLYDPQSGNKVKLEFDSQGNVDYTNGRHRIEAARQLGINYIPAEVSSPDHKSLQNIKNDYSSDRNLSQFNPKQEQAELDRTFPENLIKDRQNSKQDNQNNTEIYPSTTMFEKSFSQPKKNNSEMKNAEQLRSDANPLATEPSIDKAAHKRVEQGKELGSGSNSNQNDSDSDNSALDSSPASSDWRKNSPDSARKLDALKNSSNEPSNQTNKDNLMNDYGQNQPSVDEPHTTDREKLPEGHIEGGLPGKTIPQDEYDKRQALLDRYCTEPSQTDVIDSPSDSTELNSSNY